MANGDEVAVTFSAEGAEDITKALEELVDQFAGVEKAGDIDLSNFTSSLEEGGKAAQELVSQLEPIADATDTLSSGAESAGGALSTLAGELENTASTTTEYSTTAQDAAAASEALTDGVSPLAQALTETGTSATEASGGLTETGSAMTEVESSSGALSTVLVETGSSFQELNTSASETTANLSELGPIFSDAGTAAEGTTETFTAFVGEQSALGEAVQATSGPLNEETTLIENLATSTPEATSGMQELSTATQDVGTSAEESSSRWKTLDSSIGSTIGFMGSAASSAVSLGTGFVRLEQAQNRVEKTGLRLSKAQEALVKAQDKLNTLQASGTASADELAKASLDVQQAQEAVTLTTEQFGIQQELLNFKMFDFYANIGPQIVQTITGIIASGSQMPSAFARMGQALGITKTQTDEFTVSNEGASLSSQNLGIDLGETEAEALNFGSTAQQVTGSVTGLGGGMTTLGKAMTGIGAVMLVASAAIAVISTNAFGARDALNEFGLAVGQMIPPLEGALVAVQNFAVDVGIAGDDAKAQITNFQSLDEQIITTGDNFIEAGQKIQDSSSAMEKGAGAGLVRFGEIVKNSGTIIIQETSGWGAAIDKFTAALGRQDWGTALDLLGAGFLSVGKVILESMNIAGGAVQVALMTLGGAIQDFFFNLGNLALTALGRLGESIAGLFSQMGANAAAAFTALGSALFTEFVQPFIDAGTQIQTAWNSTVTFLQQRWSVLVQDATTIAQGIGDAFNSTVDFITDQSQAILEKLGLFKLAAQAQAIAGQIAQAINDAIATAGKAIGIPTAEEKAAQPGAETRGGGPGRKGGPTAGTDISTMGDVGQGPRNLKQTNEELKVFNDIGTTAGNVTANLTSRFGENSRIQTGLNTNLFGLARSVKNVNGGFNEAEGTINTASNRLADYITEGAASQQVTQQLATSAVPLGDNFARAAAINTDFGAALKGVKNDVTKLPPEFSAYGGALQEAENMSLQLTNATLGSEAATTSAVNAYKSARDETDAARGAAEGYIAALAPQVDLTRMSAQEVINFGAALKAGKDELDRVTTGQQEANAATLGVQQAYAQMTPQVVASAVAYQKEAQQLALGNILRADTARGTIALAEAQTQGVEKGVEFANSQFTAQASLTGYKQALSQAIAGNSEYGASLGLTTKQLENQVSFQNDVVTAQEEIINSGAEVVNSQMIQIEAWRTMSEQQIKNINTTNTMRQQLIQLNNPLADTNANLQAVNEAFLKGGEAANDFMLNLRTTSAEADGYKKRLNELIPEQERVGDTAEYTTEQMERLAAAFSGTSEAARQMGASMVEAASSFIGMLKFDENELHTKIDDAFKDVPDWIRDNFSHSLQGGIVAQGDIDRLGKSFVEQTGAAIVGAFRTTNPFKEIHQFTEAAIKDFEDMDPQVRAALTPMMNEIKKLGDITKVSGEGMKIFPEQFQKIGQAFTRVAIEAEKAKDPFNEFYQSIGGISNLTPTAAANVAQLEGGLKSLSDQGQSVALSLGKVGETAKEGEVPIVELTDKASGVTTKFANFNGTLLPVQTGLSALVGPAQLAGNALLGVGGFANAVVIRFGDIQEALVATSNIMASFVTIMAAHTTTLTTYFGTTIPTAVATMQTAFTNAFVAMTNVFGSFITIALAHITTLNTYFAVTLPASLLTMQTAFTNAFVIMNNIFASFITIALAHITTLNTYFAVTLPASLLTMQTAFANAFVIMNNTFASFITIVLAHITTLQTYFGTTLPAALTTAQTAWANAFVIMNNTIASFITIVGAHITTINTYFTSTIPTALNTGATAFTTAVNKMSTSVLTLRNNVQAAATGITTSFNTIKTNAGTMASAVTGSFNTTGTSALTLRNNVQQLADDFGSAMDEMTDHVESFADAFSSSMDDVISQAEAATSAVEELQNAIDSLKDKTVTITVNYKVNKPSGISSFQHGGSFIVDSPTRLAGARMGEFHKPELVTVTPLTNPNKISEKTIDIGRLISATGRQVGMQEGGRIINARAPNDGGQEMARKLIMEVMQLRRTVAEQKMIANFFMDGKLVDQQIQRVRGKRQESFG